MGVVVRPRFGPTCYDGCGGIVPPQRIDDLARRAQANGGELRISDRICVDCERKHQGEATVTRRPR